jgi:hypothetical protein
MSQSTSLLTVAVLPAAAQVGGLRHEQFLVDMRNATRDRVAPDENR